MNKFTTAAFASLAVLALSACGSSDDASVEAEADTVEMPANDAMEAVVETPVEDTQANAVETAPAPAATDPVANEADAAGEAAAAAAADVAAVAAGTASTTAEQE